MIINNFFFFVKQIYLFCIYKYKLYDKTMNFHILSKYNANLLQKKVNGGGFTAHDPLFIHPSLVTEVCNCTHYYVITKTFFFKL